MGLIRKYDATAEIGVPVTLTDAVEGFDDGSVRFPNLEMLLATVAVARVLIPVQFTGAEIRFLRHALDRTGAEFAEAIDLSDKSVVSRWENDRVRPGGFTEKVIRQLVLNELGPRAPGIPVPGNAIPSMRIAARPLAEGPVEIALEWREGSAAGEERSQHYAAAA